MAIYPIRSTPSSTSSDPTDAADVMIPTTSGPIKQKLTAEDLHLSDGYKIVCSAALRPSINPRAEGDSYVAH